jgi:hypothetical protein
MTTCRRAFVLAVMLASVGCITFEEQTMSYEHDPEHDRLRVHTTYIGVFGDGLFSESDEMPANELTPEEKDELLAAARGQQIYFFDNLDRVIDLVELRGQLAMPAPPFAASADRAVADAKRAVWNSLLANATISNGPFYLDSRGRLCAVQRMTIVNLSSVVKAVNRALRLQAAALADEDPEWSREAVAVSEWLVFEGNRFTVRYPRDNGHSSFAFPGALGPGASVVTRVFGDFDARRVTVSNRVEGRFVPNAIGFVRQHIGLELKFDAVLDADRFFSQGHAPGRPRRQR